jgi:hypothetical protein
MWSSIQEKKEGAVVQRRTFLMSVDGSRTYW